MTRVRRMFNAFRESNVSESFEVGAGEISFGHSPSRSRLRPLNDRTIISSIYTRIAIDVSDILYKHVQVDEKGRFKSEIDSYLNLALTFEPNLDQGPRNWRQDAVMTMFDYGTVALVPVDADVDDAGELTDVFSIRSGKIVKWMPRHVRVEVYNDNPTVGRRQETTLEKRFTPIVENPLFEVMNKPNSTAQRLIRKLSLLDEVDEAAGAGKLDLIIQLPFTVRSETKKQQAEQRLADIEFQLRDSAHGIAYADATEKITQLNRPVTNNLLDQIKHLQSLLYSQLGITEDIMNGTADEKAMLNYYNRTIEPIATAMLEAMQRTFVGKARYRKGQRIMFFRDPFKLVPVSQIAEIGDKLSRNEILTANEIRGFMGLAPSTDPKADELKNSNMPDSPPPPQNNGGNQVPPTTEEDDDQSSSKG